MSTIKEAQRTKLPVTIKHFLLSVISSPEHEVIKVSYYDRSMSIVVVRHQKFVLISIPSKHLGWLTRNLIGGIVVNCKKIAKIVSIGNLFCPYSPEPKGQLTRNLEESIGTTSKSKIVKIVPIKNPRWPERPSRKSILRFFSYWL